MQHALLDWTIRQLVSLSTVLPFWTKITNSIYHWWEPEWTMDIMFKSKYVGWVVMMTMNFAPLGSGSHGDY